ncbi:MAG: 3-oxoacyl-ACP synthase [Prevotella sp.]|nr:3-oxoacyl-ACP synthase [Prevotella sp.]
MATVISDNITSPLGLTTGQTYKAVCEGKSGLAHYPCEDGKGGWNDLPFPIEASLFKEEQWDKIMVDGFSKFESLVLHSVKSAISTLDFDKERAILILSSTKGDIELLEKGEDMLSLADSAKKVSLAIGIENDPIVVCNACISGVSAIILGQRLVDCGNYTHVIVCGADVQGRFIVSGFQSLKALSDEPCRPFDIERLGLNLGEAAATIVLSREMDFPKGWKVDKGAVCNDAYHISAPHPKGLGAGLALGKMKDADEPISVIGVHGTATMYNDQMESKAIEMAELQDVPLSALKGYFGHTMGAAGVLETIIMMRALGDGVILPSKGFETCGVSGKVKMSDKQMTAEGNTFVKMLSGFGGCNGAVRVSDRTLPQIIDNEILVKQSHSVKITQEEIIVDGERLDLELRGKEMLTEVYKTKIGDYPKFYKMDMLSRLAFVASELLIGCEGQRSKDEGQLSISKDRAVVLFNHSSSIIADRQYVKSIDKDDFFPSPAAFVYTLPNITTGEIALRNGYHGETSFYLLAERNEKLMQRVIKSTFIDRDIKSVIGGWIDCPSEDKFECEINIFDKV